MIATLARTHLRACDALIWLCLRMAVAIDDHRRWARRAGRRLTGSIRRLLARWLGLPSARPRRGASRRGAPAWNRTPPHIEQAIVRLHVEHRDLGAARLGQLARRVLDFRATRETIRRILLRHTDRARDLEREHRRPRASIDVAGPLRLWATDLTLVWLLGFWPVWLLGVIDYHGSRLVAIERVRAPTSAEVIRVLDATFIAHGVPARLLTDNGSVFTALATQAFLVERGVEHSRTRPAHPWTNGRIERLFRTFESTVFAHVWLFASTEQIDRYCRDFTLYYNRDRPHSRFAGRTPDEVHADREPQPPRGRVQYFDGRLRWYRFG